MIGGLVVGQKARKAPGNQRQAARVKGAILTKDREANGMAVKRVYFAGLSGDGGD